jgi:hypothetical protein
LHLVCATLHRAVRCVAPCCTALHRGGRSVAPGVCYVALCCVLRCTVLYYVCGTVARTSRSTAHHTGASRASNSRRAQSARRSRARRTPGAPSALARLGSAGNADASQGLAPRHARESEASRRVICTRGQYAVRDRAEVEARHCERVEYAEVQQARCSRQQKLNRTACCVAVRNVQR